MKSKNKYSKKPTILPKYYVGGNPNFNEENFDTMQAPQTGGANDVYNQRRSQGANIGQYAAYGQSAMNLGNQLQANNQLDESERQMANNQAINSTIDSTAGSVLPWYGLAKGASNMGKSTLPKDAQGNIVGGGNKAANEIMTADHQHMINDIQNKNYVALGLDSMGIGKFGRAISQLTGHSNDTTGGWKGYNKAFGVTPDKEAQFAGGGMNMQPNAEVEKQENSISPSGEFTQFNGPSHENGGIPTNLDKGEMIFSDRLKLGKKTFAQLNKPNNTNKEDKILDSKDSTTLSKKTAELMKSAKLRVSENLFKAQEQLKRDKVMSYAKKMGVAVPENGEYASGGRYNVPKYPYGGPGVKNVTPPNVNSISKWHEWNQAQGNLPVEGHQNQYYNPKEYVQTPSGYTKVGDVGKTVNYNNDPSYTPFLNFYQPNQVNKPSAGASYQPNVNIGKTLPKFTYTNDPSLGSYDQQFENYKKVNVGTFANGGVNDPEDDLMIPKQAYNPYNGLMNAPVYNPSMYGTGKYDPADMELRGNPQIQNVPQYQPDNIPSNNSNKPNWKNIATQAGLFAAQNAGSIYDLVNRQKPEVTKYDRITASTLDPTAAIRDVDSETKRATYNVRDASGGNAGSYISNRVALATQNALSKDRVRQEYGNINAQILNRVASENAQISREETERNKMARANARSTTQSAIGSIGSNTVGQYRDAKASKYDQQSLDNLSALYSALEKDPQLKAKWEKTRKGYK